MVVCLVLGVGVCFGVLLLVFLCVGWNQLGVAVGYTLGVAVGYTLGVVACCGCGGLRVVSLLGAVEFSGFVVFGNRGLW